MLPSRRFSIHRHEVLASTQDEAHRRLAAGERDFAVVARRQSAGRGRRGRSWDTPDGAALLCSFGLRIAAGASPAGPLFVLALAALETAADFLPGRQASLRAKWPNDLWADGAKLAGLLGEARGVNLALGLGLNLTQAPDDFPPDLRTPATSLRMLGGSPVAADVFLAALAERFAARLPPWESGGLAPILERLAPHWQFRPGDRLQLQTGEEVITGEYLGIDGDGALRLRPENEPLPRAFHAAEAFAVRAAASAADPPG